MRNLLELKDVFSSVGIVFRVIMGLFAQFWIRWRKGPSGEGWTWSMELFMGAMTAFSHSQRPVERMERLKSAQALQLFTDIGGGWFYALIGPKCSEKVEYGEIFRPTKGMSKRTLLYIHGGAFCVGNVRLYRRVARKMSDLCQAQVLLVEYPRAPQHPFPAALNFITKAYDWLEKRASTPIVVMGDSAGGNLCLSLIYQCVLCCFQSKEKCRLREQQKTLPACGVMLSPWLVLHHCVEGAFALDYVTKGCVLHFRDVYLDGASPENVLASPGMMEDLSGCPPMLIHVGEFERVIKRDAIAFGAKALDQKVDCRVKVFRGQVHAFQVLNVSVKMAPNKKSFDTDFGIQNCCS